jgi:hypothetical protein
MRTTRFLLTALALALSGSAAAQTFDPAATVTVSYQCIENEGYTLSQSGQVVEISGPCTAVAINGSNNQVRIDLASSITVAGNANVVQWGGGLGKDLPQISDNGKGNAIARSTTR